MSFLVPIEQIDEKKHAWIKKHCRIKPRVTAYNDNPSYINCFQVENDYVRIPLGCWQEFYDKFPNRKTIYGKKYKSTYLDCTKKLLTLNKKADPEKYVYDKEKKYRDQDVVFKQGLEILQDRHTLFLALATGFGKTSIADFFACYLGLKFVVVCFYRMVRLQWINEFKQFSNAKIQDLSENKKFDPTADGYIIGTLKTALLKDIDLSLIGLVIFDEAHVSTVTALSKSLLKFNPKYLIGLSATPNRSDGMDKLFTMYFGPAIHFIYRKEVKNFTVYKIETSFKPDIKYNFVKGRPTLDWALVKSSLAQNPDRMQMILDILDRHPDRNPLILSELQAFNTALYDRLIENDYDAELLIGSKKKWRADAKILVAGLRKAGVGFDDPLRDMLIMTTSVKDVRQNEGRIRCNNNIIYDIVDDNYTLQRHWFRVEKGNNVGRQEWYKERGATIIVLKYCEKTRKFTARDEVEFQLDDSLPTTRILPPNKIKLFK